MDYLACDLGAESGRLMAGRLEGERLALEEIHRFPNQPVFTEGGAHWNIPELWGQLQAGLRQAGQRPTRFAGISVDSWGVDYILFDAKGRILEPVFHYRDPRTARGMERALARVDPVTLFAETGIQLMPINTLFQLAAEDPTRFEAAHLLLGVADGFHYFLTGRAVAEQSLASTSQLYNPRTRHWSTLLLERFELPRRLFPPIVPSGTCLGKLGPALAEATGLGAIEVIASCSHDTGAAVAAIPARGENWAYISSGTWSLLGVELAEPLLSEACREMNFTNEMGYGGSVRLLKNIMGLWILQECRRAWAARGSEFSYETLVRLAADAFPVCPLIDPADPRFLRPGQMPQTIAQYCRETGQAPPGDPGEITRVVLLSLALLYASTLRRLESLTGRRIEQMHIVGGGSRNGLLNQFTANAAEVPVLAGPVEATAAGNVLVQALALEQLPSLEAARQVVRSSFPITRYDPADLQFWEEQRSRFQRITGHA